MTRTHGPSRPLRSESHVRRRGRSCACGGSRRQASNGTREAQGRADGAERFPVVEDDEGKQHAGERVGPLGAVGPGRGRSAPADVAASNGNPNGNGNGTDGTDGIPNGNPNGNGNDVVNGIVSGNTGAGLNSNMALMKQAKDGNDAGAGVTSALSKSVAASATPSATAGGQPAPVAHGAEQVSSRTRRAAPGTVQCAPAHKVRRWATQLGLTKYIRIEYAYAYACKINTSEAKYQ